TFRRKKDAEELSCGFEVHLKVVVQVVEGIITIFILIGLFRRIPENSRTTNLNIGTVPMFTTQ
ncbi:hypothetical protein, partial [Bacteroides fluxus]|uniref:hypothetical protein n=1 Tax=Bacteroides fluxus TaxID=626930 RepID=UPI002672C391